MSDLVEKVARAIYTRRGRDPKLYSAHPERLECLADAIAAVNLVLEAAAERAEGYRQSDHMAHDLEGGKFPKMTPVHAYIAAAIRAMKETSK